MIDEKELIEKIKDHKKKICVKDDFAYEIYGIAHDHIIELIEMMAKRVD